MPVVGVPVVGVPLPVVGVVAVVSLGVMGTHVVVPVVGVPVVLPPEAPTFELSPSVPGTGVPVDMSFVRIVPVLGRTVAGLVPGGHVPVVGVLPPPAGNCPTVVGGWICTWRVTLDGPLMTPLEPMAVT